MLTNIKELALFDMLPSRKKANLIDYFRNLPDKGRVTTLVMDMWNPYRQLGVQELPGRLIVVDKFHVLRMANEGLERVRKRIRKGLDQKIRLKLKNERFVLLKRKSALSEDEKKNARKWFSLFPELGCAYDAKERFFEIYDQPTRAAAEIVAGRWANSLPTDVAKDFRDLQVAMGNWNKEIFNYYENPVTNAYTESLNAIARQINRMTASRFCGHGSSSRRRPLRNPPPCGRSLGSAPCPVTTLSWISNAGWKALPRSQLSSTGWTFSS